MKRLVVLTGAGMSAESGIRTFRDSGGLWEEHKIEDVATPEGWNANPRLVLDFYNQRRNQLLAAKPNAGHIALAELQNSFDVQIITQNIDHLHEQAGSANVVHLHGELMKVRSTGPDQTVFEVDRNQPDIHLGDCCPNGFQLRPHIVWFGEAVPEIERAMALVQSADVFVIIGTSLQVYPAAGLLNYVKTGVPVFVIDPNPNSDLSRKVIAIQKGAVDGVADLVDLLNNLK